MSIMKLRGHRKTERENIEKWCNRGKDFLHRGEYHKAIECYDNALMVGRNNPIAIYGMALAYNKLGDKEKEIEYLWKLSNLLLR